MSVGSVDSSAASWEAQTIAAAEAYAEEQAAEAARQRQQAEAAAAAAGPNDGVDPPPSAHERALATFYGQGPQPGAAAASAPSPDAPVELSPKQVAELQAAGISLTPAGNGQYYINVPTIANTEKAPPEPYSVPAPSNTPTTTTARPDPPSAGAPPDVVTDAGATDAAKPDEEAQKAKQAPEIKAPKLGDTDKAKAVAEKAADILNKSPTLRQQWDKAEKAGYKIELGEPGSGSRTKYDEKRIYIDPLDVKRLEGRPDALASLLSHEIGHAANPPGAPITDVKDKQEFVEKNVRQGLEAEGAAAFENARARDEILQAGGPDIGIKGGADSDYIDIYNQWKTGKPTPITEAEAKSQMATAFSQEWQDSNGVGGRNRTKEEVLADDYSREWERTHKE